MSETGKQDAPEDLTTYALRFQERALRDVEAAMLHLSETSSPEVAVAWRRGLLEAVSTLATLPRRCPLAPEKFTREVRQLLYRRPGSAVAYRILFSIEGEQEGSPETPRVVIRHLRHGAARPLKRQEVRDLENEQA